MNNGYLKSDFPDYHGGVQALRVAPGRYSLALLSENPTRAYRDPLIGEFAVRPNQMTYVGEIAVHGCGAVTLSVSDRWSSVRYKFREIYPKLDFEKVQIELLTRKGS